MNILRNAKSNLFSILYVQCRSANVIRVPPNLNFEIDDAEAEWLYKLNTYDFIHCRYLFHGIRDWPKLINQALRYCLTMCWSLLVLY